MAFGNTSLGRTLAAGQGVYFLAAGLWPLVSLKTFYAVTGPKRPIRMLEFVGLRGFSRSLALQLSFEVCECGML